MHKPNEALAETDCALHAYVLMTNHVHLLLTPKKAITVPRLLMSLGRRYVQYVNRSSIKASRWVTAAFSLALKK